MSSEINRPCADRTVDVRKLTLEQAVTEIEHCMFRVALGGSIEVIVADPEIGAELQEWAHAVHHRILGSHRDVDCQRICLERQF